MTRTVCWRLVPLLLSSARSGLSSSTATHCFLCLLPSLRCSAPSISGRHTRRSNLWLIRAREALRRPLRCSASMASESHLAALSSRSEEHTSELQSLMRSSYDGFCVKNIKHTRNQSVITDYFYQPKY